MSPHDGAEGADGGATARPCGICALIERCRAGTFADFVAELPHSFVILGDAQFHRGYCVVLARRHVNEIHLMPPDEARALFDETVAVGRAIALATQPLKLNYECLGRTSNRTSTGTSFRASRRTRCAPLLSGCGPRLNVR